jgi:hypothetical protein
VNLKKKKKKKKKSKDIDESDNPCVETKIESDVLVDSEIVKKKKKKKSKESCANDTIPLIPSPCSDTKTDTNEFHEDSSEGIKKKKKKKKSKENIDETSLSCTEVNDKESVDIVLENGLVKKKKKRKRTEEDNLVQNSENQTDQVVKKKKKKKTKEVSNTE